MPLIYKVQLTFRGSRAQLPFVADVRADSTPDAVEKVIQEAVKCGFRNPIRKAIVQNIYKAKENEPTSKTH